MSRCSYCLRRLNGRGIFLVKDGEVLHPFKGNLTSEFCKTCADALKLQYGLHKHTFSSKKDGWKPEIVHQDLKNITKLKKCMVCGFEVITTRRLNYEARFWKN